jgi:hypothetical protein
VKANDLEANPEELGPEDSFRKFLIKRLLWRLLKHWRVSMVTSQRNAQ